MSGVPNDRDLDNPIEPIVCDAYGVDEQYSAFLTVIEDETPLPVPATLPGTPVSVTSFGYPNEASVIVATCQGPDGAGEVALADLTFPPDTVTTWIHAAYRRHLGLTGFPARPQPPNRPGPPPDGLGRPFSCGSHREHLRAGAGGRGRTSSRLPICHAWSRGSCEGSTSGLARDARQPL